MGASSVSIHLINSIDVHFHSISDLSGTSLIFSSFTNVNHLVYPGIHNNNNNNTTTLLQHVDSTNIRGLGSTQRGAVMSPTHGKSEVSEMVIIGKGFKKVLKKDLRDPNFS